MTATDLPEAGWYADPWRQAPWRWWDGRAWTGYAGPYAAPVTPSRSWFPSRGERDETLEMRGGWIAIAGFVSAIALSVGGLLAARAAGVSDRSVWYIVAGQVGLWSGLIGACLLAVRRHSNGSLRSLGLTRPTWRDLWTGVVAGLAGRFGAMIIVIPFIPLLRNQSGPRNTSFTNGLLHRGSFAAFVTVTIVAVGAPFIEELFFRGLVQSVLTRRFGPRFAIYGQAVCFAAVHYVVGMTAIQAVVTVLTIGAMGWLQGVLRWHYRQLWPGIVSHAVFNLIAVGAIYALN
jgi:membrane protease YdiL (CAAX protease family)